MTSVGVFLGTPNYASPEQACLMPLDERSDLYSLGLVIFEMCTGKLPFVGTSQRSVLDMHRNDPPPSPRDLNPEVPEALAELILRCLEKKPDRRFAKAAELREALRRIECPA